MITESLNVIANAAAVDAASAAAMREQMAGLARAIVIFLAFASFGIILMSIARLIEACKK